MWWVAPALAAPVATVPGSLYDHDAVEVAPDGTVWVLVAPKQSRLGRLSAVVTVTNSSGEVKELTRPRLRLVQVAPDGTATEHAIDGPGGLWPATVRLDHASLDLDPDGQPVVAILGEDCPESGCRPGLWVASEGETRAWRVTEGAHSHLALDASGPAPLVATHVAIGGETPWAGVVLHDGSQEQRWFTSPKARPQRLLVLDGQPALVYREGTTLKLRHGEADEVLSEGARHLADAVATDQGLFFQHYSARRKVLRAAPRGQAARSVDPAESGWHNALTEAGGAPLAAWYYYRNNWNKGVKLGRFDGEAWDSWTVVREADANIGWGLDVATNDSGQVAVAAADRSTREIHVWTWPSLQAAQAEAVPPAGDWTDSRRTSFFFGYGGGWFQGWAIGAAAPSEETFTYGEVPEQTGAYGVDPGLAVEGGFAGRVGPVDLVLEYMRRNGEDEAVQQLQKLQNLFAKVGIDGIPLPDSELQLHLRTTDLSAAYTAVDGAVTPFSTDDRLVELRYVGKAGYHLGLRYHGFAGPQDVYLSNDRILLDSFVADARFTEGAFVAGWSVLDYLKKYEVRFLGPYLDAQIGLGVADVRLVPDEGEPLSAVALTVPAGLDLGLAAYARSRKWKGLGGFVRAGVRGVGQYTGNTEPEEREADTPYANFTRVDGRAGPYANVGLVF